MATADPSKPQSQPSKGQQILILVEELRDTLKVVAGGTDERVQEVLGKIEAVLK